MSVNVTLVRQHNTKVALSCLKIYVPLGPLMFTNWPGKIKLLVRHNVLIK